MPVEVARPRIEADTTARSLAITAWHDVPFRLIFSYNPQRGGVFTNQLQPARRFTFRFAVGSTF